MKQQILNTLEIIGLLMIAVGIILPLLTMDLSSDIYKYIFAVGAVAVFASRALTIYEGDNIRLRRLHRIEVWGGIFFLAAAFFMFYDNPPSMRNPIAFVLAGGIIQIYTSIMIPRVAKKDGK